AINSTIDEIVNQCTKGEEIWDYFEIGLIGYGQAEVAEFCWEGGLAARQLVPVSELRQHATFQRVEQETVLHGKAAKEMIDFPVWLTPAAVGKTPMKSALDLAKASVEAWVQQHPESYPPIVINVTDGVATDIDDNQELIDAAQAVTAIV